MSAELKEQLTRLVRVRVMTQADIPQVIDIEHDTYPFPWSEGIFRDCVRVGYLCRVVEMRGVVHGYAIMSFGADEAHLLNICIHRDLRDQGVGRKLLEYLLDYARKAGMHDAFLEVRPSNPVAIYLYESLGFVRVGVRKAYYQGTPNREDAWVYKLSLLQDEPNGIDEHC
ncbi:MAG: ribosomal protein S18-alanine N-acetyltransferase [Steroidobacteraceae bacterium]